MRSLLMLFVLGLQASAAVAGDDVPAVKIVPTLPTVWDSLHLGEGFRIEATLPDTGATTVVSLAAGGPDGGVRVAVMLERVETSDGTASYASKELRLSPLAPGGAGDRSPVQSGDIPIGKATYLDVMHGASAVWGTHTRIFETFDDQANSLPIRPYSLSWTPSAAPFAVLPPGAPLKNAPMDEFQAGTQKMLLDGNSVLQDIQSRPQVMDGWVAPSLGLAAAPLGYLAPPPPAPPTLLLVSLGGSTGETFTAYLMGDGTLPRRMDFDGLVVEPLSKLAQGEVGKAVRRLASRKTVAARVDAYCLQLRLLPPLAGQAFRIANAEAQRGHAAERSIMRASRRLHDQRLLNPDSGRLEYFHSIRQWALWTREQGLTEAGFAGAFVSHTRRGVEASRQRWTREMETLLRAAVPNRWRDIQAVLREAGAS